MKLAVILFCITFSSVSLAANLCQALFYRELDNYHVENNNYKTHRDLDNYNLMFPFTQTSSLTQQVKLLPPSAVWVDSGAGGLYALAQGLSRNSFITGVGITYKLPKRVVDVTESGERLVVLEGDYIENMYAKGQLSAWKGRVDLLTDVFGPLSYTERLPLVLQVYLDLLRPGGQMVVNFPQQRNFSVVGYYNVPLDTPISVNAFMRGGRELPDGFIEWLKTIPGIKVEEVAESRNQIDMDFWEQELAIKITKLAPQVQVPENLRLINYMSDRPPVRSFEWSD